MNIFTTEEKEKIENIVTEYRKIYENASYLAVQMSKMEEEMTVLSTEMDKLKNGEQTLYKEIAERNSLSIEEVMQEASNIALSMKPQQKEVNAETI
jgi:hypothetical protein